MVFSKYGHILEEEKSNNAFVTELTEQQEMEQPARFTSEEGSGSSSSSVFNEHISNEQHKTISYELNGEDSSTDEMLVQKRSMTKENKKGDSSSSEESKPQEHSESSESCKSDEDSSSEEVKRIRLVKRSLDSPQESSNSLRKNTNGTNSKEILAIDSKETTVVESTIETTEATTQDVEAGTKTTDSLSESTTVEEQLTETTEVTESTGTVSTTETTEETDVTQYTSSETEPKVTNIEFQTTTETETTEKDKTTTAEEQQTTTIFTQTTEMPTTDSSETDEDESSVASNSTLPEVEPSTSPATPEDKPQLTFTQVAMARVNKLSDQIRVVLYNYRITKVVVIPGQTFFPDPMPMQDFQKTFSVGTMAFSNMMCHGLSNFTIEHVNTDVDKMQVSDKPNFTFHTSRGV